MDKGSFDKGIITLSFDDGRKDTYHVFMDILKPRNLPGVVYIPSGYIETGFNDPRDIGFNGLMTKEELDEINADPLFEIGGHGYMHNNKFEDIQIGADKLREWYPDIKEIGLASPHSEINRDYVYKNSDKYKGIGFCYVRGGRNFAKHKTVKRILSLLARKTKSPFLFRLCYQSSVNRKADYYLNAMIVHKLTTLEQVKAIVDYVAKEKCWMILEFHGIDKRNSQEYSEDFCWAEDDFIKLCDYVVNMQNNGSLVVKNPIEIG